MTQISGELMRLVLALQECETQLRRWSSASEENAWLFKENPAAALEAADLRLDREVMMELESVLHNLARKLELKPPARKRAS